MADTAMGNVREWLAATERDQDKHVFDIRKFSWTRTNGRWFATIEASELGLAPGHWPRVIAIQGKTGRQHFYDQTPPHWMDVNHAQRHVYRCALKGCQVTVLND